jgi:hypothetical protein
MFIYICNARGQGTLQITHIGLSIMLSPMPIDSIVARGRGGKGERSNYDCTVCIIVVLKMYHTRQRATLSEIIFKISSL